MNRNTEWILLRGWAHESRHWGAFPKLLQDKLGVDTRCPDNPGVGAKIREISPLSIPETTESVRKAIGKSTRSNRFLLGHSMGGLVAIDWARRYPEEIDGLVVMNCSARGVSPFYRRLRPTGIWRLMKILGADAGAPRESRILDWISHNWEGNPQSLTLRVAIADEAPVSLANAARQLCAAIQYSVPKGRLEKPMLVLASKGDQLMNPLCAEQLSQCLEAPLKVHPWAGHDLAIDDPQWICDQLQEWMNELSRKSP